MIGWVGGRLDLLPCGWVWDLRDVLVSERERRGDLPARGRRGKLGVTGDITFIIKDFKE
jgi:hypothetical protein